MQQCPLLVDDTRVLNPRTHSRIENGLSTLNESDHMQNMDHYICWVASRNLHCVSWSCGFVSVSERTTLQTPDSSPALICIVHHVVDTQSDFGIRWRDFNWLLQFGAVRKKDGRSRQPKFNKPGSRLNSSLRHVNNNLKQHNASSQYCSCNMSTPLRLAGNHSAPFRRFWHRSDNLTTR